MLRSIHISLFSFLNKSLSLGIDEYFEETILHTIKREVDQPLVKNNGTE